MGNNLYGPNARTLIDSGTFWRCRHGHTIFNPCWRCGLLHPLAFIKHVRPARQSEAILPHRKWPVAARPLIVSEIDADRWRFYAPARRAQEIGGYPAIVAWPALQVLRLIAMPGRLREWERRYTALSLEAHELQRTVETQNTFIDQLNDELRKTLPRVPVLPAETHAEFVEEASAVRIKSRVVGRQLTFYPDQRIDGQRLRLLIEDAAEQMSTALAEDITRDLEAFFAKRGGRHAA